MKHYVTAPGVIYADCVLVQSENMREQYVNKLTDFAGADTEEHWKEKITVREATSKGGGRQYDGKKKILYCIGANELSEQGENFMEAAAGKPVMLCDYGIEVSC